MMFPLNLYEVAAMASKLLPTVHEAQVGTDVCDVLKTFDQHPNGSEEHFGSVAESMGRMVGKTQLPVEETESGTAPMGMPEATSGTPSPNPWDLTLSRQNVLFYAEGT